MILSTTLNYFIKSTIANRMKLRLIYLCYTDIGLKKKRWIALELEEMLHFKALEITSPQIAPDAPTE